MIRPIGQQLKDAFHKGSSNADPNQWSPSAQTGDTQIAGTNNGGLTNPYAPDTSQGQYGGYVGGHAVTWAGGGGDRGNNFQTAQQNADPLFFSPGLQMPTSGQGPENPGPPGTMYYSPSTNAWAANAPGTTR